MLQVAPSDHRAALTALQGGSLSRNSHAHGSHSTLLDKSNASTVKALPARALRRSNGSTTSVCSVVVPPHPRQLNRTASLSSSIGSTCSNYASTTVFGNSVCSDQGSVDACAIAEMNASPRTSLRLRVKRLRQSFDELQNNKIRRLPSSNLENLPPNDTTCHSVGKNTHHASLMSEDLRPAKRQRGAPESSHSMQEQSMISPPRILKRLLGSSADATHANSNMTARKQKRIRTDRPANRKSTSSQVAIVTLPSPHDVLATLDARWAEQTGLVDRSRELKALRAHEPQQLDSIPDYARLLQKWGWTMRARTVDWSIQASRYCNQSEIVLWHSVRLIDEVCAVRTVAIEYLPLVATAALWIAAKLQSTSDEVPKAAFLVDMLDNAFDLSQIVWAEEHILSLVRFRAWRPTPFPQLAHLSAVDHGDPARLLLATYLTLCALTTPSLLNVPPSVVGAAGYLAAAHAIASSLSSDPLSDSGLRSSGDASYFTWKLESVGVWTAHHVRFAGGLQVSQIAPVVVEILRAAHDVQTNSPSLFTRYADDVHQNVSLWFLQWAEANCCW